MADDAPKNFRRRRRSLLAGLVLILVLLGMEGLTDYFKYKRNAIALEMARDQLSLVVNDNQNTVRLIDDLEDDQTAVRIMVGAHVALLLVAAGCLNDAVRINVGIEPTHSDATDSKGK